MADSVRFEAIRPEFNDIVSPSSEVDVFSAAALGNVFSEGPVWNAPGGYLLWTDGYLSKIFRWAPDQGVSTFLSHTGGALALTYDSQQRLVATARAARAIWRLEHDGRIVVLASHYEGKKINAPNDLVVAADGSIYWTDASGALERTFFAPQDVRRYLDFNAVFRLSPDGSEMTPVVTDFESPNGIAFSPDERLLYVNDSRRRHIRVFSVGPDGLLSGGGIFYEDEGKETGSCDGMKVDTDGNVYCRASGGIHVIAPSGELLGRIRMDSVNNLGWGDADWGTLYVVGAGTVYRIRTGVHGVPVAVRA